MDTLSTTISRSMDAISWPGDAVFSDVNNLVPLVAVCLTSILCTTLWVLAVWGHVSRGKLHTSR